ncbi:MAG: FISUMP domain-containing protein, partial [Candidatus Staskawiczbacteria bacterium]|nr:FISUMP domain-containing protein [Candidatus Staskawiczbacteria bacterium]
DMTVDTGAGQVKLSTVTWTCGDTLTDTRDAKTYTTVLIGSQCWMAENINVGTLTAGANSQGTDCPSASEIEKYCYSDTESNCTTYGGLYQWNQTMCGSTTAGATGICPTGWHIPTHDEYTTLELAACTSESCATDFPYDITTTGYRGTNEGTTLKTVSASTFSGLLAGFRYPYGVFGASGSYGYFWSSLQSGSYAWERDLGSGSAQVHRDINDKALGFSVRCIKD